MRGTVRPRVLAVAAAAAAGIIALGVIASAAVWGFRNGAEQSSSGAGGWLLLLWTTVGIALAMVGGVALVGVRALRRPLEDLSRAAYQLRAERLPAALRDIEAGTEPAPQPTISAPPELKMVAGALEDLERSVRFHATHAQRADRDLGNLLSGAADRAGARARLADGIDLEPSAVLASGLHRDEVALRALLPAPLGTHGAGPAPVAGSGSSIAKTVAVAAETTLRPSAAEVGELEPVVVDASVGDAVEVVLGELIDASIDADGTVVVRGSVQPEGYHIFVETPIGSRGPELTLVADTLPDRDPAALPFGVRAAVQAGKRARLLVWLTVSDTLAQWHVLVPPDCFVLAADAAAPVVRAIPLSMIDLTEPRATEPQLTESYAATRSNGTEPRRDPVRLAAGRRLAETVADLLARLEAALDGRKLDGSEIDERERTALLIDGTHLVGQLQELQLCSPQAQRALLRAVDDAVGAEASTPLTGSARGRVTLPHEVLVEIRACIAEAGAPEGVDIGGSVP